MILTGLRAGSPVVTDTGCCPSAAPTAPTPTVGTTIRIADAHHPSCLSRKVSDLRFLSNRWRLWATADARARPLRHGPSADRAPGDVLRAKDNQGARTSWANARNDW
jgi:hypothetical protein